MKVHLVAVQAAMTVVDYKDAEAFAARIDALTREAVRDAGGAPTLVAFPEAIGFPLLLTLGHYDAVKDLKTATGAALRVLKLEWRRVLQTAIKHGAFGLNALYLTRALDAYGVYHRAFSEAAKRYEATIVAGSIFLPRLEEEVSRGRHVLGRRVYNSAYTFSPGGRLLDRTQKCFLMPSERRAGLCAGTAEGVHGFLTPVGKVGVAICLDGFYASVIDRLDGLGLDIVVQPSANHAPWKGPWPHDVNESEESVWWRHGLRALIQDRLYLRCGLNPMLVGDVFDLSARGRSSIVANTRYYPGVAAEGYPGLLALAESDHAEELVRARLELPKQQEGLVAG